jgi:hypothetical protein
MKRRLLIILAVAAITLSAVFATKSYAQTGETCQQDPAGTGYCHPYIVNGQFLGYWCQPDPDYPVILCVVK